MSEETSINPFRNQTKGEKHEEGMCWSSNKSLPGFGASFISSESQQPMKNSQCTATLVRYVASCRYSG